MLTIRYNLFITCFLFSLYFTLVVSSNGDRTSFFNNCIRNCERQNCSADGLEIQEQAVKYYQQSLFDKLLQWTCLDECQYGCMWRTVEAFQDRNWPVPQFYGKWPFVRFLGLQEPASVLFSFFNLVAHFRWLRKFRREVRPDSPCYKIWHLFSAVAINAWIWSIVFHARDNPLTELLDYSFAYSMVLMTLYCMVMRMLYKHSWLIKAFISLAFLSYYINYFAYITMGRFSYSLNMTTNVVTGILSAMGWFLWSFRVRKQRPYYRKILAFYLLLGMSMSLELLDFPPILWILDAHALWHLSTVFIMNPLYSFAIDDCRLLRTEKYYELVGFDKEI
ncbi:post-GPI attachment to proteins factor 3-like [Musca vetustissima]|uniref:post-GPI attachment to proteins factor 3-like n=1 Tax=Musca vetustissima TaxID=27455 RepID=UPI002AB74DE2|nr:post-GPI attachment to proteins factor 3-like [Musca vetustissima]